jgi:extradiol dioxygenase
MISQLGYLGVGVKDIKAWEEFGTNAMGLQLKERLEDGTLFLRQDEYHHRFIMEPTGEDDVKYVGWMVPTMDAYHEVAAQLQAVGVSVEDGSPEECAYRRVDRFFTFNDPDGLRVEIFYGLEVDVHDPFHSPNPISGFHAGSLGLGHVVVAVKDVEETERFYRDVLGFRVSDYAIIGANRKMVFTHVNGRHHSFAFAALPVKKRITHWMMQVNTIEEVGRAYDHVRKLGIERTKELGTHMNDHMTSFYVRTPSGFAIEYGCGGREIDDEEWVVQQYRTGDFWGHEPMNTYGPEQIAQMDLPTRS